MMCTLLRWRTLRRFFQRNDLVCQWRSCYNLFTLFEGMKNLKTGGIKYQDWMRLVDLYENTSELVALPPNYVIELIKNEKEFK